MRIAEGIPLRSSGQLWRRGECPRFVVETWVVRLLSQCLVGRTFRSDIRA